MQGESLEVPIKVKVNGEEHTFHVDTRMTLLDLLREKMDIKSVHRGCEQGACGACVVLLNGKPVCSCLVLATQVDGCEIITVEGLLGGNGELHPIMRAFIVGYGLQCGYCTPGMIISAYYLLASKNVIEEKDIIKALEGNLCRCTGYNKIVDSIKIAKTMKDKGEWW